MFIRVTKSPDGSSCKVYLVEAYRNHEGKQRQRIIKKYGDLSKILEKDPNGLDKLKQKYRNFKKDNNQINLDRNEAASTIKANLNYGYFYIEQVYKSLAISKILENHMLETKIQYDLNKIMKLLVYSRIINSSSKYRVYKNKNSFFEPFDVALKDIYRSLPVFTALKENVKKAISENLKHTNNNFELIFYDLSNYYLQEQENLTLKSNFNKMVLLINKDKIPVSYKCYSEENFNVKNISKIIDDFKIEFKQKRLIIKADYDFEYNANILNLIKQKTGYIIRKQVGELSEDIINAAINLKDFKFLGNMLRYKEIIISKSIRDKNKKLINFKEKLIIYWSPSFATRTKISNKKTKLKIEQPFLSLNENKVENFINTNKKDPNNNIETKNLDNYYAIVTSEINKPIQSIFAELHEIWEIEDSFELIKQDIKGRPVYIKDQNHIEGDFLIAFIALVILRTIKLKLNNEFSILEIKKSLYEAQISHLNKDDYLLHKKNEVIKKLENVNNSYIRIKYPTLEELRKIKKIILKN